MTSKNVSMVFLCIGIVLCRKTTTGVLGFEIIRPAYMGQFWQNVYTVHSEKKSWLDATNVCRTNGFPLQYNEWRPVNEYIKMKAEMKGWNASEDVWLGLTKRPNSSLWNKCRKSRSAEINITLPGQIFYERQCAVLNMSRSSAHSNTLYAERCEGKAFGFVCLQKIGKIPDAVEMYPMSNLTETGTYGHSWINVSITECAINSFSKFFCFAAAYTPETKICNAECTDVDKLPEKLTLVSSEMNTTVLLRAYNKVTINNDVTNLPPIKDPDQFPCVYETSSNIESTTLPSALSTSVYTTEPVISQCLCDCSMISNITMEGLQQKISQIKKNLTLKKTSLSSSLRKKTSAPDERQSSAGLGVVGMCIIIGTLFTVIASDLFYAGFFIRKKTKTKCPS